jgi:hypothetical protein
MPLPKLRTLGRPVRSQSLYRLRYPHCFVHRTWRVSYASCQVSRDKKKGTIVLLLRCHSTKSCVSGGKPSRIYLILRILSSQSALQVRPAVCTTSNANKVNIRVYRRQAGRDAMTLLSVTRPARPFQRGSRCVRHLFPDASQQADR